MTTNQRNQSQDLASRRFKMLADPKRRRIIRLLLDGSLTVNEISQEVQAERSLVSHNLKALRNEGLIVCERQGKEMVYSVAEGIVLDPDSAMLDLGCCEITLR